MAFLCPSQLTLKKKVLQSKKLYPRDNYKPTTSLGQECPRSLETKSALKNGSSSSDRAVKRSVRINESGLKHETVIEQKIRAATSEKPANLRVKVTHNYDSVDKDELMVRKGQFVKVLYQKNDWIYVVDSLGNEGFIPYCYCSTANTSTGSKSSTSGYEDSIEDSDEGAERNTCTLANRICTKEKRTSSSITYFPKRAYGPQLTVLHDYKAQDENDVSVCRGEFVMLLNDRDEDWYWVVTEDGEEGFIPRTFVVSHVCEACVQRLSLSTLLSTTERNSSDFTPTSSCSTGVKSRSSPTDFTSSASSEKTSTLKGTRLIVLYKFQGSAFDDLTVRPGEYVYANLKDQIVPGWIWAYSTSSKRSGFIPEECVREPVVTDI